LGIIVLTVSFVPSHWSVKVGWAEPEGVALAVGLAVADAQAGVVDAAGVGLQPASAAPAAIKIPEANPDRMPNPQAGAASAYTNWGTLAA
jgi:hypothetical protein